MKNKGWRNEPGRHALAARGISTSFGKLKDFHKQERDETPPEELYLDESEYTQENLDRIIQLFWWSSVNDDWTWFEFEPAFDVVQDILYKRLGNHFRLPPDKQKEYTEQNLEEEGSTTLKSFFVSTLKNRDIVEKLSEKLFTDEVIDDIEPILKEHDIETSYFIESGGVTGTLYKWPKNEVVLDEMFVKSDKFRERVVELTSQEWFPGEDKVYDDLENIWKKIQHRDIHHQRLKEDILLFDNVLDAEHHHNMSILRPLTENIPIRVDEYIPYLREEFKEEYL